MMRHKLDYELYIKASTNLDDLLTVPQPGRIEYVAQQGVRYFYQTDPADGQVYIYENNWSDKLGECMVTITKPEAELSLEEQEYYKDRHTKRLK